MKRVFLKISLNSQKNACVGASFFNKVAVLRPATLLKKGIQYRCSPMILATLSKTPFLQNTTSWRLLDIYHQKFHQSWPLLQPLSVSAVKSWTSLLTLKDLCISESCTELKIELNLYFHTSLWCLKRFYEGLKGTTKKCENKNLT